MERERGCSDDTLFTTCEKNNELQFEGKNYLDIKKFVIIFDSNKIWGNFVHYLWKKKNIGVRAVNQFEGKKLFDL